MSERFRFTCRRDLRRAARAQRELERRGRQTVRQRLDCRRRAARGLDGPFNDLLQRIGKSAGTGDRRTIAASFALRYGWASAMAIAPYLKSSCVPDVSLENISLQFHEINVLRTDRHSRGARCDGRGRSPGGSPVDHTVCRTGHELLRSLRTRADDAGGSRRRSPLRVVRIRAQGHLGHAHLVLGGALHQPHRRWPRSAPCGACSSGVLRRRRRRRADAAEAARGDLCGT